MREQIQISLRITAVFFLLWSLAMASDPLAAHKLISIGPLDTVTHAMLAGSFMGFAVLLLLGSNDPRDDFTGGIAVMMIILGAVSVFSMVGSRTMPANIYTVLSIIFVLGVGTYLIFGQMQEVFSGGAGSKRPAKRSAVKKKPARKKTAKKVAKKAKKKTIKKKRR